MSGFMPFLDKVGDTHIVHFYDGVNVKVERLPNLSISAIDADNYDYDYPVGYGDSILSAIADLNEQMVARELWTYQGD